MVDVIEEDPDNAEGDEEEETYPLVDELFSRIEELELKLYEAEMRAAMVETETREEVAQEMEERMQMMDKMYRERISRENEENDRKMDEKMDLLHRAMKTGGTISPVKKSRVTEETMVEDNVPMSSPDEADILEASPSTRKSQLPSSTTPRRVIASSPRKPTRAASIEVPDSEEEPVVPYVPDLKKNPIMDMEDEDDAAMTDETSPEGSEAEEGEEISPEASSEGDGETIHSEDEEEDSDDILALDESEDDEEEDEDEDPPTKYVFEPLHPPKGGKPAPSKAKGKVQEVIELSDDESLAVDEDSDIPPPKAKKPLSKPQTKSTAAKKMVVESTDDEMENLTNKIGKTTLNSKGKGTRKSTRAKAG